jgi:hypothetical protein
MRDTSASGEVSLSLELLDHSRPVDRPAVLTGRLEEPDLTTEPDRALHDRDPGRKYRR